jgi:hypothetical protein
MLDRVNHVGQVSSGLDAGTSVTSRLDLHLRTWWTDDRFRNVV